MGLFNSKKDKENINRLFIQIEKNQKAIELLNENLIAMQNIEKPQEILTQNPNEENQKKEISRLTDIVRKQNEKIDLLNVENKRLNSENIKLNCELKENNFDKDSFVLCTGKYKGGINIPIGTYNLKLKSGEGSVETNKPEEVYFMMTDNLKSRKNYRWVDSYSNLEITEKTIMRIDGNAKIEFLISKKNDFSKEIEKVKKDYEFEIQTIKNEISILNNDLIGMYYTFSEYNNVSSQDCKNKISLLKQKEKELRNDEKDIVIQKLNSETNKLKERAIRQLLRTFNAECDNIMFNISLKNIDKSRNQIQKSFETLNKLYSFEDIVLSKELLELKLEQITLMYTYELKYQQEKDIQKAIKEQMIEEAKSQREIEEQKKKIEKDLQQHLGEINRLIKYLQKTQIDAEKQLYMDKIKELEDKIKVLEGDKNTVLEREANAKAGFVYIISNIGSFGENVYKIGMTRRLEPMDRIHELSSASVPFEFDVHAMIFSSDAPELETMLHKHFADKAVNKVNPRKEFFNVDIDEIEKIVKEKYNDTVQFTKIPLALEYRQSINMN